MRPPTRLRQRSANIDGLQLPTAMRLLAFMGNSIRNHNRRQLALFDNFARLARKDSMRDDGDDLLRSVLLESLSGFSQGSAGIRHVVDENGDLVGNVADEGHTGDFVGADALLVDERKVKIKAVGEGGSAEGMN